MAVRESVAELEKKEKTSKEWLPKSLDNGLKFLRIHGKELYKQVHTLLPIVRVLQALDDNYEFPKNSRGRVLIKAIEAHALKAAGANPDLGDSLTHETVNAFTPSEPPSRYWPTTIEAHAEDVAATGRSGGVYEIPVNPDHKPIPELGGAIESQQALAASFLHHLDIKARYGNEQARQYLEIAKDGGHAWQKISHLAHIREPLIAKSDIYGADPDELLMINDEQKSEWIKVPPHDPSQEQVRMLHPSSNKKLVYYIDLNLERCLLMNPVDYRDLLSEGNLIQVFDQNGDEIAWTGTKNGHMLREWTTPPPALSVSLNAFTTNNIPFEQAALCGASTSHIDVSRDQVVLCKSHVPEDGAPGKLESMDIAYAVQYDLQDGERPYQPDVPLTELRIAYHQVEPPSRLEISQLKDELRKQLKNPKNHNYRKDPVLLKLIESVGIQNLRIRFPTITAEQSAHMRSQVAQLNETYTKPYRDKLDHVFARYKDQLSDEDRQTLVSFLSPEITFEQYIAIGMGIVTASPIATNTLPLNIKSRLAHPAISKVFFDKKTGEPIIDEDFFDVTRNDFVLSKFSTNIYNLYKLYTSNWRFVPIAGKLDVGAQALGEVTSPELLEFISVVMHISNLDSPVRYINGKRIEIAGFDTAKPDIDDANANALALLINSRDGTFQASFRDNLTVQLLEAIDIDDSLEYRTTLQEVCQDLCRNTPELYEEVFAIAQDMSKEWLSVAQKMPPDNKKQEFIPPKNSVIFSELYERNYHSLISSRPTIKVKYEKALQVVLSTGLRNLHTNQLREIITM